MKIELIENTEFGFYNIKFSSRPDYEHNADMLNELKANGWAWSRHNGVWYPRTNEAKSKANNFATEFAKKYNESEKSFGQELFERTQRIDEWKKEHLPQEQNNEPLQEESKPVELNNNQKKVYELLKATNNFSESQILEMVSKIDTAYQTENFNIPELSWEEIKSFIHADDSFDLAKDLRDLYNPNISDTYNKINIVYNYLHDYVDFDVLGENQYESSADAEYHTMRESLRHDILYPVCENIVMGRYKKIEDFQNDFISRREEKIVDISKSYMENPAIKEQYIGMKRAELIEKAPEMLKGREFNSWIFNIDNDGHFLFYESNGYLKSEYLNDDKYNSVKDFLSQVEELDLLEESSKQLKEEYTKMHSLLEKPPVQIQDELIAKEVEEELANADERIDTSVSEYNDLGIDTRTGEPWNGEESEDVSEPETQEEESTELTQADLDNATKVIPEEQYQFMLENAAGEEAEYFKKKLKNMATICTDSQKHSNKENVNKDGSHPCKLHYFLGNCDWYISELDNDGIGFGYCILNGDLYNSEWGSVNVCGDSTYEQPLTKMSINVPIRINGSEFHRSVSPELDLHLDEDTTIERELYKLDNEYFADYKKYAEKNKKILAKSSEVSINIIEEANKELEVENGSKTDIGYERRTGISSGSNPNQGLEERGAYSDRGSDTGRGQRILHSEREENGSLENSEGISELHTVGRESEISDLHIEEIQSGNNEILHSKRSIETGNSDLQQTGMENGQIPHRVRTVEPEHGTGVNPNENTSSEPLHGNEEVIKITLVERSALNLLAVNSDCYWYIEKNKNPENYNVMSKQDLIDLGSYAYPYENYVSNDNAKIINDLLEKYDIHYQKLSIHVNLNPEKNIEQEGRPVEQLTSKKDIKAIREQCREILQKSDSEITEADKAILAQYEGAGGIKEDNRTVSGILNEFYTPNNLVEKVWQIVDAYAPGAKTVLEPSAGVGKFANNRPNNEFTMHELDETSARINKILHPDANVIQGAYQKQFFDAGERIHTPGQKVKYDVVIGNPPYGTYNDKYKGLGEGKEFDRYEEYFISKGLDALKDENSVMVFVVPSGFLNTASDKQKEIIAAKGRLIDAYRLPVGTFPTTEVGTDIIIMRTWEKDRKIIMENGKGNAAYKQASLDEAIELISDNISNGEWFKQHPEKILGEVKQKTNRFGKLEDVVVVHEGLTVQDELNKIDNFVEGINNSRKLRTYSVLNKDKINELTEVTQEEFNSIIDALYNQPSPDYKSIPSIIKLPQINQTLAQKLGVENANFFMRSEIAHVRPQRKGNYDQALRIDEMKGMLNFLKSCQTAYIDNDERHQNFILAGLDSQNSNKTNKIVFNKDENGNYIVTIGKVDSVEFNGGKYSRVAVGFEPTILRSKLEVWSPIATMLRSSTTPHDSTIPQQTEKSSQIIAPAPVQPEQTQSVSDQSETVAEEIDDPTKRLYEDPDGVFKTKHQLTREEFAKFYTGANFTQEDYNIWGATDWKGNVDTSKLTESELSYLKTSDNYVETNEGVYTNAMLYATGNIYQKLDELEENKENLSSESYEKAKAILTNAIPKVVPIENIKIDALSPLAQEFKVHREVTSSRWYMGRTELQTVELDIDLREDFINWATNCSSLDNFDENNQSINSRRSIYNYSSAKISREDIPEDISWTDIVNYIDRVPVPTHIDEKNDTKEVKNKKNLIAGNIKDARKNTCYELFNRYIQDGLPQEDKERLQSTWNRIYNATVHADYKKLPLFIDGMSTFKNNQRFMLYKQQVEGVSRLLSKGNGLLAYEVGVGKTAAGIVTTMGQLQTGRCKRPLIIVPNQVYKKWVNDFRELFPDVKINELYNLSEKYIDKHFDERTHSLLIEPGSVTVITDSALQKITFSDAVCSKELAEDFSYLLGVSDALHSGDDKEKAKAYQKILNEIGKASRVQVKKLPEGREQRIQQSYIFFDECGFDNVVIDEAHRYKNLFTIPRPKRGDKGAREFEGLGTGKPSIRAEKVFGITTLIQRRNEDRNVFLLTATPFTNNPLEVYSMLSYMGRKELINRHIYDVRDFCTEFAQTKFEYSVKPTGDIEPKQVMKNFRGQKKLKNLVFEYIDVVSAKEAGIERPEGERHPIYLELSPLQQRIIKLEQDAIAASDDPSVTLKAMTTMRTCTLSPALLEPDDFASVEDIVIPPKSQIVESSPKLSWVCNTVADLYKQKPECGQFIYMPQGKDCFDEVKKYLIKQGIPDDAIDYIHSTHNGSAEDKDKISARFNNKEDKLKILIGTATVAEGIDLNGNSIVEYNTMLGWNPTESIQVEGRIWRQGNEQGKVHIMYPLMENSIDALIYQKHDEKASRINSVLSKTDDGKDAIDTDEINPETIKFELITDPAKKVKMIIDEKTAEKRKEIKVIDNRLETIQELEKDRQNSKTLYDTNVEEKEKYKSLLKTAREELKADPNNWQKEARVTSNERAVDTCNKEIAKARNRLNAISYNFNKFDIHEPEREVPIKLQELVTKKAELEADITDIENSKDRLIAEEQKKLLEKKILSKPVEELRKEWVEYVNKNTWYKKQNDKSKDRKETVQVPLEAVKDFKVPDEMIKKFDKAMAEMDFKVLHNYLNWGDRDIINDCHENDKAIVIFRERYEKTKGVKLPEQFRKTTEYLVSVCDGKTLPEVCKFKSMKEAVAYACSSWHGEAYQRDGYVEYVTLDNFKKNRDVSALAKDLQNREGQSYYGYGSPNGFGYDCSPKGVKIEAFINKKREEFFVNWNQVAKIKAKQWNREYPAEFTIKDEPKREGEEKLKNIQMVQQDLFDFDEVKVQTKTLDIRMQGYNSQFILSDQALENYRGLPPFIKKSDNEWVIRCKGEDFAKPQEGIDSYELVDISLTKDQLQGMVKAHLFAQQQEISHKKFDDPEYKGKVICPKSEVSDMQKELLKSNGISDNNLKKVTKENFNELLCDGEKPILKKKLPQPKQLKQENNQKLLPSTTIEIAEDTDFDYVY